MINKLLLIAMLVVLTSCGSSDQTNTSWPMKAVGEKSVLFLPVYFDDVKEEMSMHSQREQIYVDAFSDISAYMKTRQIEYIGKQIMSLKFSVGAPVRAGRVNDYFYNHDMVLGLVNGTLKYDIVAVVFYTKEYCENSHADPHLVVSCRSPESVTSIDYSHLGIRHSHRNYYTSLYLHEFLHEFGMTDLDGNQGKRTCYVGENFDGTQNLSSETCANSSLYQSLEGNIGEFQDIDKFIAKEIGWADGDGNGVVDAEE